MNTQHPNDPLHGLTLEHIVTRLVKHYGWSTLGTQKGREIIHFIDQIMMPLDRTYISGGTVSLIGRKEPRFA